MNPRQKKFAEYYASSGNASEAARQAGYSESYASHRANEMLEKVEIAAYIKAISSPEEETRIICARKRQEILSDLATDDAVEPKDRIRAIDTLNKMTGEYTVRVEAAVQPSAKLAEVMDQLGGRSLEDGE